MKIFGFIIFVVLLLSSSSDVFGVTSVGTNIVTGGNIGIGTTNPVQKLEVVGSIKMVDGNQASGKYMASDANGLASWAAAPAGVPTGGLMYFDLASCPTGWTELTAGRGRFLVGLPSGGTLAGTVGTALTNLEDRTHTHSFTPAGSNSAPAFTGTGGTTGSGGVDHTHAGPSHTHTISGADGGNYWMTGQGVWTTNASGTGNTSGASAYSHTHSFTPAGSVAAPTFSGSGGTTGAAATSNTAPYIQYLLCKKD